MHRIVYALAVLLGLGGMMAGLSSSEVFAQAKQAPKTPGNAAKQQPAPPAPVPPAPVPPKQIALTEKQIEGVLAAQPEIEKITQKAAASAKPDPTIEAQLDAVVRKNGFAGYAEYDDVADNINLVLAGFDPQTKQYVGPEAVLKAQIAALQADKKMPAKNKKQALDAMNAALKTPAPAIDNKGNIDLVAKYYDKLSDALGKDD